MKVRVVQKKSLPRIEKTWHRGEREGCKDMKLYLGLRKCGTVVLVMVVHNITMKLYLGLRKCGTVVRVEAVQETLVESHIHSLFEKYYIHQR